ncbi:MAG: AsmA family protein [Gemmatimonadetes bacterium]|nr:AsmA family protein [Gemmatimonadota bacterium]
MAALLAIALVAYLALIVVFRAIVDPASLADRAEPHISSALNRRVSIGSADLQIFPRPQVRLLRLRIENLPDFEGTPLATVDEVLLRPRLLPLLRRRLEIDRVRAVGPRVLLQVDGEGRTNFGDFVPASREGQGSVDAPLALEISGIQLVDGRIGYRDAVSGRTLQADGLRLEGAVGRDAGGTLSLDLDSGVESLRFAYPPAWPRGLRGLRIEAVLKAVAGPEMRWIQIDEGAATINGLTVDVIGRVDSVRSPRRFLDLALRGDEVDLSDLISALPDSLRATVPADLWGDLGVDVTIRGVLGPGEFPGVDGMVTLRSGGMRRGQEGPLLEELDADIRLSGAVAEFSGVRARLPGGEITGSGSLAMDTTLAFEASVEGRADAGELAGAFGTVDLDGASLSRGSVRWNVAAEGALGRLASTRLAGDLGLDAVEITGGSLVRPVEVPSAVVRLEGTTARWDGVRVVAAGDPVRTSGRISDLLGRLAEAPRTPALDASIQGAALDFDALLGTSQQEIGYGRIAWARLADRLLQGRAPEEWAAEREFRRPGLLPVTGRVTVQLDSVLRLPYRLDRVRGLLLLGPDRVVLEDFRFGTYGGTGSARGTMRLGDVDAEPFRLEMSLKDVRAEQYLAQNTPLGTLVSGTLDLDLTLEGSLDRMVLPVTQALAGVGRFDIRDGRIEPNPLTDGLLRFLRLDGARNLRFTRWSAPLIIDRGLIVLDGSNFAGSELVAQLQGALGFGGSVDLGALVRPDSTLARAATSAAGAAGEVIDRYVRAGGALELALRLTGTATNPRFQLDPDAMERSTQSVIEGAAAKARESGEAKAKERGLEVLRGLTGQKGRDSAATARDSAPAGKTPEAEGQLLP